MATYEVNDDIYPNKTVVYIRCKFKGKEGWGNGSGTIVGKNDILTASHVVYDERYDGWATETRIYTSRNAYLSNSSSYYTYKWARGRNWDENGDGLLAQGDNKYNSLYETENDIALLSLATDIGSIYGSMGLKFDFQSGTASKLGYPGKYNYNLYYDEGFVDKHSVDNYFQFDKDEIEINGGDSGGPIYVNSGGNAGYQVIGIISGKGTISGNGTACALNAHSTWIKDEIESNNYLYDKSFATITSPESVDEGSSISFTFKTHKSEENTQYTYTLSGVSSSDFSSTELSGTTTIDKNGEATFTLDISADQATEGTESFTLSIGEKTKSISINDTSIDEVVPIIIGPSGSHGDTTSTKTINENSSDIHIFKANETVTWSLNGGLDAAKFTIDSSTGALIFNTSPNYEFPTDSDSNNDYIVVVRATDSTGNASNQTVTVSINNLNETPTSFLLSTYNFNENIAAGTTVGTLYGVDEDTSDTHTFSFLPGFTQSEGNSAFTIDGNKLKIKNSPNYEIQKSYTIVIKATDQSGESSKGAYYRTLTVNDLNETPTALTLSSSSFNENIAAASAVATLSSTDPDSSDTHTYSLVTGTGDTDNNSFAIDGSALKIKAEPDYETKYAYKIRLQTTDSGGETYSKALTLSVNDLN